MALSAFADLVQSDDAELDGVGGRRRHQPASGARSLQAALHEALSRLAPVSADYYYSFTGRFETLAHVVELTVELQAQAAARNAESEDAETATPGGSFLN